MAKVADTSYLVIQWLFLQEINGENSELRVYLDHICSDELGIGAKTIDGTEVLSK